MLSQVAKIYLRRSHFLLTSFHPNSLPPNLNLMVFIWEMDLLSFNDAITLPLLNRRGTLQASGHVVVGWEKHRWPPMGWGLCCFGLDLKSV